MECVNCKTMRTYDELKEFLYIALDYQGNMILLSDYASYPRAWVDPEDNQITFEQADVKAFIKPDTKLIFQNGIHKIIR